MPAHNKDTDIIITQHAINRIQERWCLSPKKLMKVTKKAWLSKLPVHPSKKNLKDHPTGHYRHFCGYTFIFNVHQDSDKKYLLTVFR